VLAAIAKKVSIAGASYPKEIVNAQASRSTNCAGFQTIINIVRAVYALVSIKENTLVACSRCLKTVAYTIDAR